MSFRAFHANTGRGPAQKAEETWAAQTTQAPGRRDPAGGPRCPPCSSDDSPDRSLPHRAMGVRAIKRPPPVLQDAGASAGLAEEDGISPDSRQARCGSRGHAPELHLAGGRKLSQEPTSHTADGGGQETSSEHRRSCSPTSWASEVFRSQRPTSEAAPASASRHPTK